MSQSNDKLLSGQRLVSADLDWHNGQPRSRQFDDVYRSPDGAMESQRVFIEPSNLSARWSTQADFTIAELGFGLGLNLAVLLEHWQQRPGTRLHFISFEAFPLHQTDWQRVCAERAPQIPGYRLLSQLYPPTISGWHRRVLEDGAITLHLFFGDASDGLADLQQRGIQPVDAWWLDGFAPDRNPALWTPTLFEQLPALSKANATVATFTVAGRVRRGLGAVGFEMRRVDQLPIKRESLAGVLKGSRTAQHNPYQDSQQLARTAPIQVVGAGIAGATVARALADAGLHCQVFDAGVGPTGSSSLPAAVMHGRLLADGSPAAALRVQGQLLASAELQRWPAWQPSGVLQCASSIKDADKLHQVSERYSDSGDWCTMATEAQRHDALGDWLPDTRAALWFPYCGSLHPGSLIGWLLQHPRIETHWQQPMTERMDWDGIRIYTNGSGIQSVAEARFLELSGLGGQIERVTNMAPPKVPLVGAGYAVPLHADNSTGQETLTGGNYEYTPWQPAQASAHNLRKAPTAARWLGRWRGVRITSSDRLPIAGPLVDRQLQASRNRWVSVGHGSQGMTTSFMAAAAIASELAGLPPAIDKQLEAHLAPLRFRQRQARRGYRFGASG
ncbi:MAG: tRNA (5-methylaminomethyl-2-thiouridine)(34)-methyltransferase MnmD [Pseudomonadales bacterium]